MSTKLRQIIETIVDRKLRLTELSPETYNSAIDKAQTRGVRQKNNINKLASRALKTILPNWVTEDNFYSVVLKNTNVSPADLDDASEEYSYTELGLEPGDIKYNLRKIKDLTNDMFDSLDAGLEVTDIKYNAKTDEPIYYIEKI